MKAVKVRLTKCYLIQILDKEDNELESDFNFVSYQDAKKQGQMMKDAYNERLEVKGERYGTL